ncbi:MAG: DUF6146 family protein [Bacteroidota bacterium]
MLATRKLQFIKTVLVLMSIVGIAACGHQQKTAQTEAKIHRLKQKLDSLESVKQATTATVDNRKNDSISFSISIQEEGFEEWLTQQSAGEKLSQTYLKSENKKFIKEFNKRAQNKIVPKAELYQQPIAYNPSNDYGYEVNYILYQYFIFFEEKYNQKLR